eukprot:gnl/TRDRNA2_/TRDRNA2_87971_c0_seq1.p1 gnl/TRDRNA2_/TRDRNA2_87971_c0~~gnl/TRDRNA2_/TRDRNA2_87971_c0_seq1.p1  ORF type:complete len:383 (-),score=33.51 gnl/TRDRNA2_/TRDRNA2_87971_c0_seq1:114-1136(-)
MWRSVDGGGSWDQVEAGPHWCPRSRLAVCGAATDPSKANAFSRPIGIMYVVGGQTRSGLCGDVWASDTAGRSWHCMTENGPFGPRADVSCAVVPPDPMCLVVAGGMSVDYHRDVWLSRDAGETFAQVDMPMLPTCCTLLQWPPHLLCVSRAQSNGDLVFWKLRFHRDSDDATDAKSLRNSADLEVLDEDSDEFALLADLGGQVHRPPRVGIDIELNAALSWDIKSPCLKAHPLLGGTNEGKVISEVSALGKDVHILCDMDAANVGWEVMRHGRIWILAQDGSKIWATSRARFFEQERFIKLLGIRLADVYGMPYEIWMGRVRPLLLPFRVHRSGKAPRKP